MIAKIKETLLESSRTLAQTAEQADAIEMFAKQMIRTVRSGGKILVCGNGGSAADSQHFACELIGTFMNKKRKAFPVIALTVNSSSLTSIGNDLSFDEVFRREVEALGKPGDMLVAITTSGNSPNVLKAVEQAKAQKMHVVGLTGGTGGKLKPQCDLCIVVPNAVTPRIQETHITIIHTVCALAEEELVK